MQLYVYDHCPFCVRARMIFGLKNIAFELKILANDDEQTPISMIGKKMLPILHKDDGCYLPESLDIVNYIDKHYGNAPILTGATSQAIADILNEIQTVDYILVYPRLVQLKLPEFATQSARDYFENRKQARSGPFAECLAKTAQISQHVEAILAKLVPLIKSHDACHGEISMDDICLFPILRNLTCVKGLHFPESVKAYVESMAKHSQINLYFDQAV